MDGNHNFRKHYSQIKKGKARSTYVVVSFNHGLYYNFCVSDSYREKALPHVAMVAKFLDDNKPKKSLKSLFALFQTSPILFNFI